MSYEIEYTNLESPETIQRALEDCRNWLGPKQYKKVCKILKEDSGQTSRNLVRVGLMMQGIQGYPAEVMIDTYWGSKDKMVSHL